jgi:hypothetical protein
MLRQRLPAQVWNSYKKFMFVRNPWDWVISQYFYNLERKFWPVARLGRKTRLTPWDITRLFEHLKQYRAIPEADSLFQSTYAYNDDGTCLVDYIGRFEYLQRDFSDIMNRFGIPAALPKLNTSPHGEFQLYYTDDTIKLVADLYAVDIANFNYQWNMG